MKMIKNAILLATLLLNGCGTFCVKTPPAVNSEADFAVLNTLSRNEPSDNFCAGFSLTPNQAEAFFNRGKEIDAMTMHNQFDWLNCFVEGNLNNPTLGFNNCAFSIQAGGTATIQCEANKAAIWGCDTCDDLLRDSE